MSAPRVVGSFSGNTWRSDDGRFEAVRPAGCELWLLRDMLAGEWYPRALEAVELPAAAAELRRLFVDLIPRT